MNLKTRLDNLEKHASTPKATSDPSELFRHITDSQLSMIEEFMKTKGEMSQEQGYLIYFRKTPMTDDEVKAILWGAT